MMRELQSRGGHWGLCFLCEGCIFFAQTSFVMPLCRALHSSIIRGCELCAASGSIWVGAALATSSTQPGQLVPCSVWWTRSLLRIKLLYKAHFSINLSVGPKCCELSSAALHSPPQLSSHCSAQKKVILLLIAVELAEFPFLPPLPTFLLSAGIKLTIKLPGGADWENEQQTPRAATYPLGMQRRCIRHQILFFRPAFYSIHCPCCGGNSGQESATWQEALAVVLPASSSRRLWCGWRRAALEAARPKIARGIHPSKPSLWSRPCRVWNWM